METTPSSATISVIVPVYNSEKTLRKCVESICSSDYPHLEIICVNDGSSDTSPEILRELAAHDPRIVVINQENGGLSAARNAGLDAATGEYVAGVDSDDFVDSDLFSRALGMFTAETDIVSFGITEEYDPPESSPERKMYNDEPYEGYRDVTEQVVLNMHPMFWLKLWRRSVIEEHHVRFHPRALHEDVDFFMKVVIHCRKICFLRYPGYHYLQHADSIMGKQFGGHATFESIMGVERRLHRYYREKGLWQRHMLLFAHWMVRRSAAARHYFPASSRAQVQEAYYNLSLEFGLQEELPHDFPLQTLKPVMGWKKLFFTHLPNTRIYRFMGFPLFFKQCQNGEIKEGMFNPLKTLSRLFGRRGA